MEASRSGVEMVPVSVARWWRVSRTSWAMKSADKPVSNVIRHDTKNGEINTYDMSSNIKIEKICEWCGNKFTAQTTVTRFCSKRCSEHSYKERMRQRKIALSNQETKLQSGSGSKWRDKDFPHIIRVDFTIFCIVAYHNVP